MGVGKLHLSYVGRERGYTWPEYASDAAPIKQEDRTQAARLHVPQLNLSTFLLPVRHRCPDSEITSGMFKFVTTLPTHSEHWEIWLNVTVYQEPQTRRVGEERRHEVLASGTDPELGSPTTV